MLGLPNNVVRWLGPAIIIAIGILVIVGDPLGQAMFCSKTDNCLATWVGALSGWAALAGAVLTIFVMREQLAEQKRQTDYLLGEGQPEMYLQGHAHRVDEEWYPNVELIIANRNRRALQLHRLELASSDGGYSIGVREVEVSGEMSEPPFGSMIATMYIHRMLAGKEDGDPAPKCRIRCNIFFNKRLVEYPSNPERWEEQEFEVIVYGYLKDRNDREVTLSASGKLTF